jgi:CDP-diglyceride synthetase
VQRTITGLLYVAIIITSLYLHPLAFISLFIIIMIVAMVEWYSLITTDHIKPQVIPGIGTGIVVLATSWLFASGMISLKLLVIPLLLVFLLFFFEMFRRQGKFSGNLAFTSLGLIYIALPLSLLPFLGYRKDLPRRLSWGTSSCYGFMIQGHTLLAVSLANIKSWKTFPPENHGKVFWVDQLLRSELLLSLPDFFPF